ncbi:MAG TPA: EamA family transporter [Candidatus Nanoarchaeia archaeon]|nr:EamA family transporter [Candidatus Nanoarchaeia archaeon]
MSSHTRWWSFVLIISTTFFITAAQYFFKTGAELKWVLAWPEILLLWPILAGFVCYGLGAVLMIIAFKGGQVTVLYPIVATSYAWVVIMSAYAFGEPLNILKIGGSLVLIAGITLVAYGSKPQGSIKYEEPL